MRLQVNERVSVRVVRVLEGVILVEHDGLPGSINLPELTWDERLRVQTTDFAAVGDVLDVRIVAVSTDRFSASITRLDPVGDPWLEPPRVGSDVCGTVYFVRDWGTFINLRDHRLVALHRGVGNVTVGEVVSARVTVVNLAARKLECEILT